MPDEKQTFMVVGHPPGAVARRNKRIVGLGVGLTAVGAILGLAVGAPDLLALLGLGVGVAAGSLIVPKADRPIGIAISDKRIVVARQQRGAEPTVMAELPPTAVERAEIDTDPEPFWFPGGFTRLSLHGVGGALAHLDLTRVDPASLLLVLQEVAIPVTGPADGPAATPQAAPSLARPLWLVKALAVGLLCFLGVVFVLLAVPAGLDEGLASGAGAFGIGAVLFAVGLGLRRLLFRPTS